MDNKLEGFGPLYIINLERRIDRREHMTKLLDSHGITNYTFVPAFDVKDGVDQHIYNPHPVNIKRPRNIEIATTMSHLKAIKYWLDNSDTEYAIFAEDDLSLDTVQYWNWSWQDFINSIDFDYDVLQLCITHFTRSNFKLHKRHQSDYSAGLYLIKRNYAKLVISNKIVEDKYNLNVERRNAVIDHDVIFNKDYEVYSCSLFTYENKLGSDVNPNSNNIRVKSYNSALEFWKNNKMSLKEFVAVRP